jgi:hypothetical protein
MHQRLAKLAIPFALLLAIIGGLVTLAGDSRAELDNQVFTSRADRLRLLVPRGWRATDQPSYPGLQLWMMRTTPPGHIVLSSETFTRQLYCSWPISCRQSTETMTAKYACALRTRLQTQRFRVGPTQQGPKENEAAGLPSVWFEYDDGKRFLRQAVAMTQDRAFSLVLSAPSNDARAQHVRPFDQTLRTMRLLTIEEVGAATPDAAIALGASDAPNDASTLPIDGAVLDAGITFESAPAKEEPVGPCNN